jgi:hypothetical protein
MSEIELVAGQQIDPSWITWDADHQSEFDAGDLIWTFEPEYPLEKIGGKAFIEQMMFYLDSDIDYMLEGEAVNKDSGASDLIEAGFERVADWVSIDRAVSNGHDIQEPVHLPEVRSEDEPERNCIADGWHRIGAYIKAGRKTIPAFVGRVPNANELVEGKLITPSWNASNSTSQ